MAHEHSLDLDIEPRDMKGPGCVWQCSIPQVRLGFRGTVPQTRSDPDLADPPGQRGGEHDMRPASEPAHRVTSVPLQDGSRALGHRRSLNGRQGADHSPATVSKFVRQGVAGRSRGNQMHPWSLQQRATLIRPRSTSTVARLAG